jgi:succinate dehydrogenase flavin-adding protein (antitoxin of CptAB toxin-antitoxin module)
MNEDVYAEALAVWEAFFLFNDVVTRGCDDTERVAVEEHAQELDNLGAQFMAAYLEVAADSHVTVYMHIMACHRGDLVRQWGGLMKWCSQGAEAMYQMTKIFARKRSARRGNVSKVVLTRVYMTMKIRAQPSRMQRLRHSRVHVTGNGHVSKATREVHEQTQNQVPYRQL